MSEIARGLKSRTVATSNCSESTFFGVPSSHFGESDGSAAVADDVSPNGHTYEWHPAGRPVTVDMPDMAMSLDYRSQAPEFICEPWSHNKVQEPIPETLTGSESYLSQGTGDLDPNSPPQFAPALKIHELVSETPPSSEDYLSPSLGELESSASPPFVTPRKDYFCDARDCTRTKPFGSNADLIRHKASVHKEGLDKRNLYVCAAPACQRSDREPKIWSRKDNFKTHCKTKHGEKGLDDLIKRSKELAAQTSSRSSNDIPGNNLAFPEVSNEARYFRCEEHGAAFKREAEFKRHMETVHGPKRLFECLVPSCSRRGDNAFPRKDHWRGHMSKAHDISYVMCGYEPECLRSFDLSEYHQYYQAHLETDHQERPPVRPPRLPAYVAEIGIRGYRPYQPDS